MSDNSIVDTGAQLYYATAAFLATHFMSSSVLRDRLVGALGERNYLVLYSTLALATLGWMGWAYSRAPLDPLWVGLRWLPAVAMPFACVLIACGVLSANPTAVGASALLKRPDPAQGIIRVTRHPVMWGIMLWALAHVLARGEQFATVFFGGLFALAWLGSLLMEERKARILGDDWRRFAASTSHLPLLAILQGRNRLVGSEIGWRNPAIGLALYALLVWLHPLIFGTRAYLKIGTDPNFREIGVCPYFSGVLIRTSFIRPPAPLRITTSALRQPNRSAIRPTSSAFALPSTGGDFRRASHTPSPPCSSVLTREPGLTFTWIVVMARPRPRRRSAPALRGSRPPRRAGPAARFPGHSSGTPAWARASPCRSVPAEDRPHRRP
jgi:uncharacterized membrane protein